MEKLQGFIRYQLPENTNKLKDACIKILITLITLATAAIPWILLIVRVSINGAE